MKKKLDPAQLLYLQRAQSDLDLISFATRNLENYFGLDKKIGPDIKQLYSLSSTISMVILDRMNDQLARGA